MSHAPPAPGIKTEEFPHPPAGAVASYQKAEPHPAALQVRSTLLPLQLQPGHLCRCFPLSRGKSKRIPHFQREGFADEWERQRGRWGLAGRAITVLIPFDLPALETKQPLSFFLFYRKIFSRDLLVLEF